MVEAGPSGEGRFTEAVGQERPATKGPSREALLKAYDAEEADALLALEQKMDGRGEDETAVDPEAVAEAVSAAVVNRNGS